VIAGIVLAAGASSRLGRPKQLLPFRGRPLLEATLEQVAAARLDEVVVVVGGSAEAVLAAVQLHGARPVVNPDFLAGQSTSLRVGLAAVAERAAAVVFILGDQPLQQPAVIDALVDTYGRTGAPIVAPTYNGRRGNPILFDRTLFGDLLTLTGDTGARPLLRARAELIQEVPVAGDAPPADIDTWDDYRAMLRAAGEPDPGPWEAP
jgi:molybdenum cofactor cytidylyltransferase